MSFTDLMSSSRGPGVVGMVVALFVLIGFGALFTFAFDDKYQGEGTSIDANIREFAKDIDNLKLRVTEGQAMLDCAPARVANSKELLRLTNENVNLEASQLTLKNNIEQGQSKLLGRENEFAAYKDEYRAHVRAKAKGAAHKELKTNKGEVYKDVNIRVVNAVGIQIRHDGGQKRIPYEELPEEMQDYFQFDVQQKEAALAEENENLKNHHTSTAAYEKAAENKAAELAVAKKALDAEKMVKWLAAQELRVMDLTREIETLNNSIMVEGEKRMSRAPQLRTQLAQKQRDLASLRAAIARSQGQ